METLAKKIASEMTAEQRKNFARLEFLAKYENKNVTGYSDLIDLSYFVQNLVARLEKKS